MLEIDNIDQSVVTLLIEDGRMNAAQIARRLGSVTERVVRYRLDRLIEGGVIRVSAIVDPKALGLSITRDSLEGGGFTHPDRVARSYGDCIFEKERLWRD
ncbi:MAG: winged helix-turn-helix transcriptional regulator [Anaerolineales bacterium]|nr:winged helix-turn-helix transcriptional regulator [Anaerolineales bacterium]